ncbi:MAG: hypothetical protein HRT42_10915 [Campylobacteraceae bacterium]|nr:hypothetical protein [Campylobacteraceae bacterium]
MKLEKLGKIFDPRDFNLKNNCFEFSQSPQVIIFSDFIRIYFSTREKDKNNKYLSHISFVDMTKNFEIIDVSKKTIIELGEIGTFDQHGIFPMNVLKVKDKIFAYTTGWSRRVSVSVDASVGLAISNDNGLTFEKVGQGPVLAPSINEPFLVGDAFVKNYNDIFHMWYIYGLRWINNDNNQPERVYKIAHAISKDGIKWEKENKLIIEDKLNEDECQALPSVIEFNNTYHMFFCYREAIGFRNNREKSYKIGYAHSDDLITWTRNDSLIDFDINENDWDGNMQCYPHVFEMNNNLYILYNGNDFGRYGFGLAKIIF